MTGHSTTYGSIGNIAEEPVHLGRVPLTDLLAGVIPISWIFVTSLSNLLASIRLPRRMHPRWYSLTTPFRNFVSGKDLHQLDPDHFPEYRKFQRRYLERWKFGVLLGLNTLMAFVWFWVVGRSVAGEVIGEASWRVEVSRNVLVGMTWVSGPDVRFHEGAFTQLDSFRSTPL